MKATTLLTCSFLVGSAIGFALPSPVEDFIGEVLELAHMQHLDKRVCPHDNLLRCLVGTPSLAVPFCSSSVGIFQTPSTVQVTITPTVPVTAISTSTETLTSTTSVDVTQTTSTTITVTPPTSTVTATVVKKRTVTAGGGGGGGGGGGAGACTPAAVISERAVAATSLACISNLKPSLAAVSSACSCFSGSYAPSITPVTETVLAPPVMVTPGTVSITASTTVGITVTV
ncbi:hypothetical protein NKR23_g10503 [Pleurostoma richardsiae]|uniref:Uncharacterized protein n=1 Tax=Pleurostoma richardsiae TaxID=41990 RepID=A0AA38R544_9PEZI|nr:hypothetical protein NKR23_g10503 [Pleurostoma richardsiae]